MNITDRIALPVEAPPVRPPATGVPDLPAGLPDLLAEAAGAPPGWAAALTPGARLDADLMLDEYEISLLAQLLRERHGTDLAALRAGLDLDELAALTVGDLIGLVRR
ncbi:hypothetical protein ACWEQL_15475 [Kitasatospora sp. NPDC004240]